MIINIGTPVRESTQLLDSVNFTHLTLLCHQVLTTFIELRDAGLHLYRGLQICTSYLQPGEGGVLLRRDTQNK